MNLKIKPVKITLIVMIIIFSISTLIFLPSCTSMGPFSNNNIQDSAQSQGMETYTVVRDDIFQESTTTGSIDVKTSNTYTFEVSGEVISALEQGDIFKKGQVLVELDDSEGREIISELENNLIDAEESLVSSKNSLSTSKINYQKALDANHIAIQLADINILKAQQSTESAFASLENANISADLAYESAEAALEKATTAAAKEEAQNKLDSTKASNDSSTSQAEINYEKTQLEESSTYWNNLSSLQSAQAQINLTRINISEASLKLKQAERSVETLKQDIEEAKKDLENYKILAPYDGTIGSNAYKAGERSGQGAAGISIISNEYVVKATISENDMPKVKAGNEVIISLDAYSDVELKGTLEKINRIPTTTNGIVTYDVLISFQDTESYELFYGLSANLSIITEKAENVLYVPIQSVYKENGKSYVDVLKVSMPDQNSQADEAIQGQSIEKVEVVTGINDYVYIEIKSGINEGDIIVVSNVTE